MKHLFYLILNFFYRQYMTFKLFPAEIKKAWELWFPKKQQSVTYAEVFKRYKRFSKNDLFKILCELIADEEKILPIADRKTKHDAKKHNSKNVMIRAIFNTLNRKVGGNNELEKQSH